jgi:CMP-2-keto-3-deoxyoctulosonic acid synthetase
MIDKFVQKTLAEQYNLVLALDDPQVIETTKKIAFYAAMIDAASHDPLTDRIEQAEMMAFFKEEYSTSIAEYQQLVNSLL